MVEAKEDVNKMKAELAIKNQVGALGQPCRGSLQLGGGVASLGLKGKRSSGGLPGLCSEQACQAPGLCLTAAEFVASLHACTHDQMVTRQEPNLRPPARRPALRRNLRSLRARPRRCSSPSARAPRSRRRRRPRSRSSWGRCPPRRRRSRRSRRAGGVGVRWGRQARVAGALLHACWPTCSQGVHAPARVCACCQARCACAHANSSPILVRRMMLSGTWRPPSPRWTRRCQRSTGARHSAGMCPAKLAQMLSAPPACMHRVRAAGCVRC